MSSTKGHNTMHVSPINSNDFFPLSQFSRLSKRSSAISSRSSSGHQVTTVDKIYDSILKELTSSKAPKFNPLAKKASGILRLSKQHPSIESDPHYFDIDYDYSELLYNDVLDSQNVVKFPRPEEKKFSAHLEENQADIISKLALNGGKFSEIWKDYEATNSTKTSSGASSSRKSFGKSLVSGRSDGKQKERPSWKYFANTNLLSSTTSNSSVASSLYSTKSNLSGRAFETVRSDTNPKPTTTRTHTEIKERRNGDYMKHVFVIKGQVITFKGDEFKSFSNWFGNEELLDKCQLLHRDGFRRELDLSGFSTPEIRMKIYENYKLVIEAFRPMRNGLPPLRFKTTIVLPKEVSVERLIICRTCTGRLVIQDAKLLLSDTNVKLKR